MREIIITMRRINEIREENEHVGYRKRRRKIIPKKKIIWIKILFILIQSTI